MTNQEAIKRMESIREYLCAGNPIWDVNEMRDVFELAISALQAQEAKAQLSAEGTTSDLISRQDAIDIVTGYSGQLNGYIGTPNDTDVYAYARGLILGIERNLNALPSAHPVAKDTNVPCKDTISRTEAMNAVSNWLYDTQTTETSDEVLLKLPSAQPEIIRCKDCRWRKDQSGSSAWLPCRAIVTPSDFYCGRAERRTDA